MKNKITLVMPTSLVVSAPATHLMQRTLDAANARLFAGAKIRCIVHCDIWDQSSTALAYLENLRLLSEERGFELISGSRGLGCTMRELIGMVETPYYFWLEHDWQWFRPVDLEKIIGVMDSRPELNYVRFNKRRNSVQQGDLKMEPFVVDGVHLLKNDNWSCHPHIGRSQIFNERWSKNIPSEPNRSNLAESYMREKFHEDIAEHGFEAAWKRWGVCVYGPLDQAKVIIHLDGNKWQRHGFRAALRRFKRRWRSHN